ncbi:MAG: GAF domain-containing protein [Anaerolineales bacterium]|nr:GAF domain-containing protein [Anaerolineales bacterium]
MSKEKTQTARSLAATLAIAFFTLSVVVLLVSSGLQLFSNIQTQQAVISSQQLLVAQEASKTVSNYIEDNFRSLEAIVELTDLSKISPEQQKAVLESVLGYQPAFRQVIFLNIIGNETAHAARISQTEYEQFATQIQTEIEMLTVIEKGQRYISPIYIDNSTSEPLIFLAVPVTNALGDFKGTLVAELNLKFIWNLVNQIRIGKSGIAYVVDRQGNLIAFNDLSRVLKGENVANLEKVGEFVNWDTTQGDQTPISLSRGINGATVVTTFVPLESPDWAVVTEMPWQEAYQNIISTGIWSILVTLGMALLAGLIGIFVARRLAVPLIDLTDTATKISEGDIELVATVGGPSETVRLANAFNSMTAQLRSFIGNLEQRVAERTGELEAATQQVKRRADQFEAIAQVSRVISSIQDQAELLPRITRMISQHFGFYHVGIFLLDENNQYAVLRAANSKGGQRMLARRHRLEVGQTGIVGYVTATGNPRIALDTGADAVFFNNPDLPETRSEMALPLTIGGKVVGALDVQSTEQNAFSHEDVNILSTLADQVSTAIQNARLYDESREALAQAETAYRRLTGETWANVHRFAPVVGYRFDGIKPEPLTQHSKGQPAESQKDAFSVPLQLRGEAIGRLRIKPASTGYQWTENEIAIIQATAERVALAAENARLVAESQKSAAKEQVIGEISSKIGAAINLDNILQTTLREMGRILPGAEISIQVEKE